MADPAGALYVPQRFYNNSDRSPHWTQRVSIPWPDLALLESDEWGRPPMRGGEPPGRFEAAAATDTPPMSTLGIAGLFRLPPELCAVQPGLGLSYEFLRMGDGGVDEQRPVEVLFVPYAPEAPGSPEAGSRALAAIRARLPGIASAAVEEGPAAFVILLLEGPADKAAALALANCEGALVLRASVVTAGGAGAGFGVLNLRGYVRAAFPEKDSARFSALAPFLAAAPDAFAFPEGAWGARGHQAEPGAPDGPDAHALG
jgi:hypothetical protein